MKDLEARILSLVKEGPIYRSIINRKIGSNKAGERTKAVANLEKSGFITITLVAKLAKTGKPVKVKPGLVAITEKGIEAYQEYYGIKEKA